jgi:hypothetical protein
MQRKAGFNIGVIIRPINNTDGCRGRDPEPYIIDIMEKFHGNNDELFIISHIGPKRAQETMVWLKKNDIVPRLVFENNVYFLGGDKRAKIGIVDYLDLDYYMDDNKDVLHAIMKGIKERDPKKQKKIFEAKGQRSSGPWEPMTNIIPTWRIRVRAKRPMMVLRLYN